MDLKQCGKCHKRKSIDNFWQRMGKHQPNCIECQKALNKTRYNENKEQHIERVKQNNKKRCEVFYELKKLMSCCVCGESFRRCLDFHHLESDTKEGMISRMIYAVGYERLNQELKKCVVVCKNCHTKIHCDEISLTDEQIEASLAQVGRALGSYPRGSQFEAEATHQTK